jgi:hypothetical protein
VRVGIVRRAQLVRDILNGGDPDCVVGGSTLDPFDPALRLPRGQPPVAVPSRTGSALSSSSLMPSLIGCTFAT